MAARVEPGPPAPAGAGSACRSRQSQRSWRLFANAISFGCFVVEPPQLPSMGARRLTVAIIAKAAGVSPADAAARGFGPGREEPQPASTNTGKPVVTEWLPLASSTSNDAHSAARTPATASPPFTPVSLLTGPGMEAGWGAGHQTW